MDISCYVDREKSETFGEPNSTFRKGAGRIMWLHQARRDVGLLIAKLAADVIHARAEVRNAKQLRNCITKRSDS